ncbi:hypothetical protein DFH08DRAFT_213168 [Mycena albidolilacea]|uniref:Uncharacterized protein n=1 Tax=Mycena albidolilacea TaxID=1033008 RepID=A0AAD6ZZD0_9AGAR|nr:hypothetical protein DFH08DRAFT_213168 [Mycena albidolilacea]
MGFYTSDVPDPRQGVVRTTLRRVGMMLVGVIAPEMLVFFAARQLAVARKFISRYPRVSLTHGFFFSMGGFVSRETGKPITIFAQLTDEPGYLSGIQETPREDIIDKSKGDALSKGIALLQGLWFIVQIIARVAQRLPVSQLEVTTLAFAVVNLFMWLLWWHRPLDVHQPILLSSRPRSSPPGHPRADSKALNNVNDGATSLTVSLVQEKNISRPAPVHTPVPREALSRKAGIAAGDSEVRPLRTSEEVPIGSPAPPRRRRGNRFSEAIFFGPIQGTYAHYEPRSNGVVPAFWSSHDEPPPETAFAAMLVGVVFGAIHCAAWNASFLSPTERILWRVSAVVVAGYPALLVIPHGVGHLRWDGHTHDHVSFASQVLGVALYAMFRIVLIVLPLIALRSVDKGLLIDVDWTLYIPHL